MKIVFMGTPEFALPTLQKLATHHEIVAVYTRAPKIAGRGNKLQKSPVHLWAEEQGLKVFTPASLRNQAEQQKLASLKADVGIVAAYGLILPAEVINLFPYGCLNVHGSLLPRWRGAAPMQRAIEAGDKKTGITIMQVVPALDAGAMYKQAEVAIDSDTDAEVLHDKMALLGADLMLDVLSNLYNITPTLQDESQVTYAKKIDKEECKLDFNQEAEILERKIRAFSPYPGAYIEHNGERFKLLKCKISSDIKLPATELKQLDKHLYIGTLSNALEVITIQRQGKKAMSVKDLLLGYSFS